MKRFFALVFASGLFDEDRTEKDGLATDLEFGTRLSVDEYSRWMKKSRMSYFGYKGFLRVDADGYAEKILPRLANEGEAAHFAAMTVQRHMADLRSVQHG